MKRVIETSCKDRIIEMYMNEGCSVFYISAILDIDLQAVKNIVKKYTGFITDLKNYDVEIHHEDPAVHQRKMEEERTTKITKKLLLGYTPDEILETNKSFTMSDIERVQAAISSTPEEYRTVERIQLKVDAYSNRAVNTSDIAEFKKTVHPKDRYHINVFTDARTDAPYPNGIDVEVISTYPHIVLTDKGAFQYFDLYCGKKIS